jgi:hypothetical protein
LKADNLQEEILIQLEAMTVVVDELIALQQDVALREPTLRKKTATAAFLAQFYNGIENILKRISGFHNVPLPEGETWHVELFQRFASPSHPELPVLFNDELAHSLAPYRRFRHVVFHSYGFQLEWERMDGGVKGVSIVFNQLKTNLSAYLSTINRPAT